MFFLLWWISNPSCETCYSETGINKKIITKKNIVSSGAVDVNDVLKLITVLMRLFAQVNGEMIHGRKSTHHK